MKFKLVFATATAVGLLMGSGVVLADSNTAVVDQKDTNNTASITQNQGDLNTSKLMQDGTGNSASVTQTGERNHAGDFVFSTWSDPTTIARRNTYGFVYQNGSDNQLTVLQTLNGSNIGGGGGVTQTGNHNVIMDTQHGGTNNIYAGVGGNVDSVTQTSSTTATGLTNKLTVLQQGASDGAYADVVAGSSDYHYADEHIGTVTQTSSGGSANTLTLTQKGGIYEAGNTIVTASQNGTGNTGTITQIGRKNYTALLSQTGAGNTATVTLNGTSNGSSGTAFTSATALAVGVGQSTVTQNGTGDQLSYSANGQQNLYGFSQTVGTDNEITGTTSGNSNEAAVNQIGGGNVTDFTQRDDTNLLGVAINGDDNGVGAFRGASDIGLANGNVSQSGGGNNASITITGSDANYSVKQSGGGNVLTVSLTGGDNNNFSINQAGSDTATVHVTGGQNVLGARQLGAGTNSLEVTVVGSLNNWSGNLSGNAGGLGLTAGSIYQNNNAGGTNNDVNLDVETSSNLFAVKQIGSGNSVVGTVNTGTGNQAAVVQSGIGNTASYTQSGGGNNVGISQ